MSALNNYSFIYDFLQPYQELWQNEILYQYPHWQAPYPEEWLAEIRQFSATELYWLDGQNVVSPDYPKLHSLVTELKNFLIFNPFKIPSVMKYESRAFFKISQKKQHEIERLIPLILKFSPSHVVDFCSGKGLLDHILAHYHQISCTCYDFDQNLQKSGLSRFQKFSSKPQSSGQIHYQLHDLKKENIQLETPSMAIGLHACGELSDHIIKLFSEHQKLKSLINFGCCYHKTSSTVTLHRSFGQFKKSNESITLSPFALTLASRQHHAFTREEFDLKERVKLFRYGLHLYLYYVHHQKSFLATGNAGPMHPNDYLKMSFEDYVLYQLKSLNRIQPTDHRIGIKHFFSQYQNEIQLLTRANIIRNVFGRLIETVMLAQRALKIKSLGHQVEILEVFDEAISPKNLAIVATKND
jgi:hypothetical protein